MMPIDLLEARSSQTSHLLKKKKNLVSGKHSESMYNEMKDACILTLNVFLFLKIMSMLIYLNPGISTLFIKYISASKNCLIILIP